MHIDKGAPSPDRLTHKIASQGERSDPAKVKVIDRVNRGHLSDFKHKDCQTLFLAMLLLERVILYLTFCTY